MPGLLVSQVHHKQRCKASDLSVQARIDFLSGKILPKGSKKETFLDVPDRKWMDQW